MNSSSNQTPPEHTDLNHSQGDLEENHHKGSIRKKVRRVAIATLCFIGILILGAALYFVPILFKGYLATTADDLGRTSAYLIVHACQDYAYEHEGKFPPNLKALVPEYLELPELLTFRHPETLKTGVWEYSAGTTNQSSPFTHVVRSPEFIRNLETKVIIGRADGSVICKVIPKEESETK